MASMHNVKTRSEEKLFQTMYEFFQHYGTERTYLIAFSGGLDSHVLLFLCHQFSIKLHAIYINHGLSPSANEWGRHSALLCKSMGIQYTECSIQIDKRKGESIENKAREKRYACLKEFIKPGDMLLTAHHQDDQAETLLMQLFRGSGLKGLSAMPMVKPFGLGFHARPLLKVSRSVLKTYAEEQKLNWIEDESNQNLKLDRNFIRHQILPLLKDRFPSVAKTISRVALHCADAQKFIDTSLMVSNLKTDQETLSVSKLLSLKEDQQKFALRKWIAQRKYPMPSENKLITIQQNVLIARNDRNPCVKWQQVECRRYRDHLFLMQTSPEHDETAIYPWDFFNSLRLPNIGTLHAIETVGQGLRKDIKQVSVQFRRGGESILLPKRGHRSLKKIFQEEGVLPWERSRLPLIFVENKMIGIVGYFFDENYCVKESELGFKIYLENF